MIALNAKQRAVIFQFMKFGTVGAIGFVLDYLLVSFYIWELGFTRTAAGYASFPLIVTFTWIGNRTFTFHDAKKVPMGTQWAKFVVVCLIGLIFNRGTYTILVNTVPLVYDYPVLGLLAGTGAGMFLNFFASRRLVFR